MKIFVDDNERFKELCELHEKHGKDFFNIFTNQLEEKERELEILEEKSEDFIFYPIEVNDSYELEEYYLKSKEIKENREKQRELRKYIDDSWIVIRAMHRRMDIYEKAKESFIKVMANKKLTLQDEEVVATEFEKEFKRHKLEEGEEYIFFKQCVQSTSKIFWKGFDIFAKTVNLRREIDNTKNKAKRKQLQKELNKHLKMTKEEENTLEYHLELAEKIDKLMESQ